MRKMLPDLVSRLNDFCWPSVRQKWAIEKPSASNLPSDGQSSLSSRNSQTTTLRRSEIYPKTILWHLLKEYHYHALQTSSPRGMKNSRKCNQQYSLFDHS